MAQYTPQEIANINKFLNFLGRAEGANYNTLVGGTTFSDLSKHPRKVGLTTANGPSKAAGKYQITETTYDDFAPKLGITDFSEASQDKIALAIIQREGALDYVKAGNWKPAIDKLGGRWASLPSSKWGQKTRSWEWVEKELNSAVGVSVPPTQFSLTNPSSVTPTASPNPVRMLMEKLENEEKYGGFRNTVNQILPSVEAGFKLENNAYNWTIDQGMPRDMNFTVTSEKLREGAKDLPEEVKPYLAAALSDDDFARRVAKAHEMEKKRQELANYGDGMTLFGTAVGTVFDIDTLLSFIPVAGEVAAGHKASRLARAVRAGLASAAISGGSEFAFGSSKPFQEDTDVYLAALFGLGVGAAGGFMANPRTPGARSFDGDAARTQAEMAVYAQKEANRVQAQELKESGLQLTEAGENFFSEQSALRQQAGITNPLEDGVMQASESTPTGFNKSGGLDDAADSEDFGPYRGLGKKYPGMSPESATMAAFRDFESSLYDKITHRQVSTDLASVNQTWDLLKKSFPEADFESTLMNIKVVTMDDIKKRAPWLRIPEDTNAFYAPPLDATFLIAGRLNDQNVRGIALHDLGVHHSLERMVGPELYQQMISAVEKEAAKGNKAALQAIERAKGSKDFLRGEEQLGYFLEHIGDKKPGWLREVVTKIKLYLRDLGLNINLKESDLISIVQGSLVKMSKGGSQSFDSSFPYVWAGSHKKFEKFDSSYVGTGEAAGTSDRRLTGLKQGWGLYASSVKFVGNNYRVKETGKRGMDFSEGGLYRAKVVDAAPDHFLKWNSTEQPEYVRKILEDNQISHRAMTGEQIYHALLENMGEKGTPIKQTAKAVSEYLYSLGIKGNRYDTGNTKHLKDIDKSSNWVFYSDKNLEMDLRFSHGSEADVDPDLLPDPSKPSEGYWQGPSYENFFNRSWVPDEVKGFVRSIFGSTTGYKDHSVVAPAASDQKRALAGSWQNQFAKTLQPAIQDYLERNPVPFMKRSEALEKWNEQLGDYIRGVDGDYDQSIIKVGNEWRRLASTVTEHINNPGKFNGDVKQGLTQREIIDPETGEKKLSDPLEHSDTYLPRHPDTYKLSSRISQFGRETVEGFIGNMFKAANSKIDDELAGKLGKWYLATIEDAKLNRASELVDNYLRGFDRVGFKDSLLKISSISPDEADRIISSMSKPAKGSDAGALNSSLKRRSMLDETYTETIQLKDGSTTKLSYKDLFDTDTVGLINGYFHKMAGSISFANHTGIYDIRESKRIVAEMTRRGFSSEMTTEQQSKMLTHLQDIVDLHLGRPLENFSTWNKALQMVADYNVLTKAGMFVLNQITEMSQLLGSSMRRSVLRAVPELSSMIRDTKTGKVSNEVIDSLENLSGGPGTQLLTSNPLSPSRTWVREKGDTQFNRWLDSADNVLKKGVDNLFKFTGMTGVTMMQQRTFAVAMVNHFVDHAVNGKKLDISPERLAWMGLDSQDATDVFDGIRKYHKAGQGKLGEVDFTKWSQDDPKTFSKFIVAYQRESARVIQENDLASMVPIMGKTVGKMLFQFMGFPLQAWNKSMLFAVNHKDMQTLHTVMWAVGFNMLMYTARTQAQMVGMSAEDKQKMAEERLSSSQIMLNAIGRIPQLSILPNMFDTVSPVPLFSGMRTSTDLTDFVSGNPTISTISSALSMTKKLARNAGSEDYQTTERDVRAMFRLVPLNNMIGISNIVNSVASEFPSRELVDD